MRYLGVIDSSGSSANNSTCSTPFIIPKNCNILIQPDADGYVLPDATSSTSSSGVKILSDTRVYVNVGAFATVSVSGSVSAVISFIPSSGSGNLRVWSI